MKKQHFEKTLRNNNYSSPLKKLTKKELRKNFRDRVFRRDENTCRICDTTKPESELDAHHITDRSEMPNGGYVAENGITVCKLICHHKAELYHISGGKEWNAGLHPEDLYRIIGSSYNLALEKSYDLGRIIN